MNINPMYDFVLCRPRLLVKPVFWIEWPVLDNTAV